jgi:hypothetical protein
MQVGIENLGRAGMHKASKKVSTWNIEKKSQKQHKHLTTSTHTLMVDILIQSILQKGKGEQHKAKRNP